MSHLVRAVAQPGCIHASLRTIPGWLFYNAFSALAYMIDRTRANVDLRYVYVCGRTEKRIATSRGGGLPLLTHRQIFDIRSVFFLSRMTPLVWISYRPMAEPSERPSEAVRIHHQHRVFSTVFH